VTSKLGHCITYYDPDTELKDCQVILGFAKIEESVAFFRKNIYPDTAILKVEEIWVVEPWS